MGTTVNLNNTPTELSQANDSIVIKRNLDSIEGGRSLDVTGVAEPVLKAGHVIIMETATGVCKPMPVTGAAYASLPANHEYIGILVGSILTSKPFAGIMVRGTVNPNATPFPMTAILAAFKTAKPLIDFRAD